MISYHQEKKSGLQLICWCEEVIKNNVDMYWQETAQQSFKHLTKNTYKWCQFKKLTAASTCRCFHWTGYSYHIDNVSVNLQLLLFPKSNSSMITNFRSILLDNSIWTLTLCFAESSLCRFYSWTESFARNIQIKDHTFHMKISWPPTSFIYVQPVIALNVKACARRHRFLYEIASRALAKSSPHCQRSFSHH